MSDNLGTNFNEEEKNNLLDFPSFNLEEITGGFSTSDYLPEGTFDFGNPLGVLDSDQFSFETNYFNTTEITKEIINKVEEEKKKEEAAKDLSQTYTNPLRKIAGGRVLQYPIDLNTDLQDYFEIQIFKYRPAGNLPSITNSNQIGAGEGGYGGNSNQRGNRQNFRLQDLQSTIQLPMPPSIKDLNQVDWGSGAMSGLAASVMGPAIKALLGGGGDRARFESAMNNEEVGGIKGFAKQLMAYTSGTREGIAGSVSALFQGLQDKQFRRYEMVNAIAQGVAALGINIEVDQAITRVSGAVRNPNLELLFKSPTLRNFSFTIRLTPRSSDESKRIRMIIRALKQHSAAKINPQPVFNPS